MTKKAKRNLDFWIEVIEKLNINSDIHGTFMEVFESICNFFSFGCTFSYKIDERGLFVLKEWFSVRADESLKVILNLEEDLGRPLMEEMSNRQLIVSVGNANESDLEKKLREEFESNFLTIIPVMDQNGKVAAIVGFIDRRSAERFEKEDVALANAVLGAVANRLKLQIYKERVDAAQKALENMLDNMGFDVYVNDFYTHEVLYVNKSMAEPYGGPENMLGKKCYSALYEGQEQQCEYCPQMKLADEQGRPTKVYSWDYQRPFDGAWFRVISAAFPWVNGRLAHVVSSVDISDNKRNEAKIKEMALSDMLTTMPNRRKMIQEMERLEQEIIKGIKKNLYLFFVDLDNFKFINDIYGHLEGDKILKVVSASINGNPITKGKSYRLGGDEFVILLCDPTVEELKETVRFLKEEVMSEHRILDDDFKLSASVGIACYPKDAKSLDDLIHYSDIAMYRSKKDSSKKVYFYSEADLLSSDDYFKMIEESAGNA